MRTSTLLIGVFLAVLSAFCATTSYSQDFPNKPIRLVVPINPGTSPDLVARILSPGMSQILGQPVVVENRPGANQMIAYEFVAKNAAADGYTLAIVAVESLALAPVTIKDIRFDPLKDLTPVIGLVEGRYVLNSPAGAPWNNFNEMLAVAKANPGKFNYGSVIYAQRFAMEAILQERGLGMTLITYPGSAFMQALAGNEIQLGLLSEGTAAGFGPKLKWLAVSGQQRLGTQPDVPTFAEVGFPQIVGFAYSFNVRAGTPRAAVEKLYSSSLHALNLPESRAQLGKIGVEAFKDNSAEAAVRALNQQAKFYSDFAKRINFKPE